MFVNAAIPGIFLDSWENLDFKVAKETVNNKQLKNAKEFLKIKYHIKRIKNED